MSIEQPQNNWLDDEDEVNDDPEAYDHTQYFKNIPITPSERVLLTFGTEHSVALAFSERFNGNLKFDHHSNKWLMWDGKRWLHDSTGLVAHYCRLMATELKEKITQRSSFISGVEKLCKKDPIFSITSSVFDQDNYLFNCPKGTIDLTTGEMLKHDQQDLITNIASCSPIPGYGDRFPQFLDEITCKDYELQIFLQTALGACLSGGIEDHWLMFWIGAGRNGKNTLGDAVMRVMGSYARKIPSSTLVKSRFEGHPTEIANLKGCRLAVASEVDASAFWSEARINELTGDAKLTARYMRGDFFEFDRTFKLLVYGNHRPRLNSITPAMKSRLKMVRFAADFSGNDAKADPDLPAKLKAEDSYILTWLIDGHLLWIKNGKKLPKIKAVEDEVADYMSNQATPENWMDECLISNQPGIWTKSSILFFNYTYWKRERNEHAVSQSVWSEAMQKRYARVRKMDGWKYETSLINLFSEKYIDSKLMIYEPL